MTTSASNSTELGGWELALSRELVQVLAFSTHATITRQEAIDRLKGVVEWLELCCTDPTGDSEPLMGPHQSDIPFPDGWDANPSAESQSGQFYSDGCGMTDLPDPVFPTDYGD